MKSAWDQERIGTWLDGDMDNPISLEEIDAIHAAEEISLAEIASIIAFEDESYRDAFRRALALVRNGELQSAFKRDSKWYAARGDVEAWAEAHRGHNAIL